MPPERPPTSRRLLRGAVHGLRVTLFGTVILLIHLAHRERLAESASPGEVAFHVKQVQALLPSATRLEPIPGREREFSILAADDQNLGRALQTSPNADDIVGFSGPTNVLIVLDPEERLIGIDILSSRDTPEHVAQVEESERFFGQFRGLAADDVDTAPPIDGVSGATLTSMAIAESVLRRLGASSGSLRFPNPPEIDRVRELFPEAASVAAQPRRKVWWDVRDASGATIGRLVRTSPVSDSVIGYQGPTDAYLAVDADGLVTGFVIGHSYDNEPYVSYVRQDYYLKSLIRGRRLEELAELSEGEIPYEGVSGATMTSIALVDGIERSAQVALQPPPPPPEPRPWLVVRSRDVGTIAVVLLAGVVSLTRLRGWKPFRILFQLVLIGYLGFVNGDLLSQAMLVGWARSGVPFDKALGLVALTAAALLVPMFSRTNLYCAQICPHGAAQQLLKRRLPWQPHLPPKVVRVLSALPWLLLVVVVAVAMTGADFSLVNLEAFDAYVFRVAGWASITIAVVGLIASLFVPMAYCRFGCPTGAVLNYLRFHSRGERLTARDVAAGLLLLLAAGLWFAA